MPWCYHTCCLRIVLEEEEASSSVIINMDVGNISTFSLVGVFPCVFAADDVFDFFAFEFFTLIVSFVDYVLKRASPALESIAALVITIGNA